MRDWHVHTTISDGSCTVGEVLAQAVHQGIASVAVTNHDTTAGLTAAVEAGRAFGVEVVGGIEISAWDATRNAKVHVLGLGLSEDSPAVNALRAPTLAARDANSRWQLDRLLEAGFAVDVERALELAAASTALYKQHLMAALTDAPYGSAEYQGLYRQLFKGDGICARDIAYVDARDAVAAIVEDGGRAVLAHPGQLNSYGIVPELVTCGLSGIERDHPDHGPSDRRRCDDIADRYRLMRTSGSDYHGAFGSVPHLGYGIPAPA